MLSVGLSYAAADTGYDDGSRMVSKATRRGPMDEMRQLVRILVKIIPHSVTFLASAEEGGGGNRISEERIKYFLDSTLGEAPRPSWGVPQGWGEYLAGERQLQMLCLLRLLPQHHMLMRKLSHLCSSVACNFCLLCAARSLHLLWARYDKGDDLTGFLSGGESRQHAAKIGKISAEQSGYGCAELFSWISEQPVTREQAMRCAKREPGRSWEAITTEIRKLGVALWAFAYSAPRMPVAQRLFLYHGCRNA